MSYTRLPAVFVPDCRFNADTLDRARTTATEAGPVPGGVVPALVGSGLRGAITGAQGAEADIQVIRGGTRPRVAYRPAPLADATDYRGWLGVGVVHHVARARVAVAAAWRPSVAVDESTGVVLLATGNGAQQARVSRRDPVSREWTLGAVVGSVGATPAVWYDADRGRTMLLARPAGGVVWQSSDHGATWTRHAVRAINESAAWLANVVAAGAAWQRSGVLWLGTDGTDLYQLASTDGGATFDRINATNPANWAAFGGCIRLRDGGYGVWWWDGSGNMRWRVLGAATQPLDGSLSVIVATGTAGVGYVVEDYSGRLVAYLGAGSAVVSRVSGDRGRTWQVGPAVSELVPRAGALGGLLAVPAAGEVVAVTAAVGSGGNDRVLYASTLGGWTNQEFLRTGTNDIAPGLPYGRPEGQGAAWWLPYLVPGGAWVAAGAGSQSLASDEMTVTTSANSRSWYADGPSAVLDECGAMFDCRVVSGGSASAPEVGARVNKRAAGGLEREFAVCMTTTGWTVRDMVASANLATFSADLTQRFQILVIAKATGAGEVWFRRPGFIGWTLASSWATSATVAEAIAVDRVIWGHPSNGTGESRWRLATHEFGGGWSGSGGVAFGRDCTRPTPVRELRAGSTLAWLSVSGRASVGETARAKVAHQGAITNALPHVLPSRSVGWVSLAQGQEDIVYDLGAPTLPDAALMGLVALGFNGPRIVIAGSNDGTTFTTIATCDAPVLTGTAVDYGDAFAITGAATPDWLSTGEWVDAVALTAGAASRVVAQRPGQTRALGGPALAAVFRRGVTSGSWTAGAVEVRPASRVHAFATPTTAYRWWRIRVSAMAPRPEGRTEAGVLALCAVHVLGGSADWGEQSGYAPRIDVAELPSGRRWARKAGPARRRVTVGWEGGVDIDRVRTGDPDAPVHTVYGVPVAGVEDLGITLDGVLASAHDGAVPVVLVRALPAVEAAPLVRPDMWCYGWWVSPIARSYVYEEAGDGEAARVESITVEEAV